MKYKIFVVGLCLVTNAWADDTAFEGSVEDGVVTQYMKTDLISMEREELVIGESRTEVNYDFHSFSNQDLTMNIAFPVHAPPFCFGAAPLPENLKKFEDLVDSLNGWCLSRRIYIDQYGNLFDSDISTNKRIQRAVLQKPMTLSSEFQVWVNSQAILNVTPTFRALADLQQPLDRDTKQWAEWKEYSENVEPFYEPEKQADITQLLHHAGLSVERPKDFIRPNRVDRALLQPLFNAHAYTYSTKEDHYFPNWVAQLNYLWQETLAADSVTQIRQAMNTLYDSWGSNVFRLSPSTAVEKYPIKLLDYSAPPDGCEAPINKLFVERLKTLKQIYLSRGYTTFILKTGGNWRGGKIGDLRIRLKPLPGHIGILCSPTTPILFTGAEDQDVILTDWAPNKDAVAIFFRSEEEDKREEDKRSAR